MLELIKANVLANFAYYRRSRLLLAFLLVSLLLTCLSSLPALYTGSGIQSFNALHQIFSEPQHLRHHLGGCCWPFRGLVTLAQPQPQDGIHQAVSSKHLAGFRIPFGHSRIVFPQLRASAQRHGVIAVLAFARTSRLGFSVPRYIYCLGGPHRVLDAARIPGSSGNRRDLCADL